MKDISVKLIALLVTIALLFTLTCCAGESSTADTTTETNGSNIEQTNASSESDTGSESAESVVTSEKTDDSSTEVKDESEEISKTDTEINIEASTEKSTEAPTEESTDAPIEKEEIKNIILIIGDGMGLDHIAAGQLASGEQYQFTSWQRVVCNTDSVNSSGKGGVLTDSAASATALATGTLTVNGYLGKDHKKKDLKTILDYAKEMGKAVGIVTTDNIYGATPSGFSAHSTDRNASKVITKSQTRSGVDFFLGLRSDSVYGAFESIFPNEGYYYSNSVDDIDEALTHEKVFLAIDIESGAENEITLSAATSYAIDFLDDDEDGFVLIIEQAYIDKCSHNNDFVGMIERMYSLADTVDTVIDWIGEREDTAVLVTADHETGGLAVSSSPTLTGEYVGDGGTVYFAWGTGNHTDSDVGLFVYGFSPDFSTLEWYGSDYIIKNTEVFVLMKGLLDKEIE